MADTIAVEIPAEVLRAAGMTAEQLLRELAVYLYREEKLSLGKAAQLASMTNWDFQLLLGTQGVKAHYGVAEYERDLLTLRETSGK